MLWHKAWLETRWRFISALLILTVMAGSNVYDYLATQRLLPLAQRRPCYPATKLTGLGRRDSRSDRGPEGFPRLHLVPAPSATT